MFLVFARFSGFLVELKISLSRMNVLKRFLKIFYVSFYLFVLELIWLHNGFLFFYQIGPDQIEALYQYAKFQFECGNYSGAADYLYQYRALCTNSERSLSALWGKLAAEILMQNWDIALEELNRLKESIDSKVSSPLLPSPGHPPLNYHVSILQFSYILWLFLQSFSSPMNQVQNRIWLMHWSLFIFFNNDNGRSQIIDLFNQDKYVVHTYLFILLLYFYVFRFFESIINCL